MNCPKCGGKTRIVDSRDKNDFTSRRRKCESCGYKFNTEELEVLGRREKRTSNTRKVRILNNNQLVYMGVQ